MFKFLTICIFEPPPIALRCVMLEIGYMRFLCKRAVASRRNA